MKNKYADGGKVRGYEEDITPPRGMRGMPTPRRPSPPSYEEDITPPRGMRGMTNDYEERMPTPPIRPRGMKAGGAVRRGDGCVSHGKTKGKMV
jgi:hypothetical protein